MLHHGCTQVGLSPTIRAEPARKGLIKVIGTRTRKSSSNVVGTRVRTPNRTDRSWLDECSSSTNRARSERHRVQIMSKARAKQVTIDRQRNAKQVQFAYKSRADRRQIDCQSKERFIKLLISISHRLCISKWSYTLFSVIGAPRPS